MNRPPIGFAILSHRATGQLHRLCRRLDRSFPGAPIVVHHDLSQAPCDETALPASVRLVRPHVVTRWGGFSLVDATLAAFRTLVEQDAAPEWIVLLSAADYPLHGAMRVVADLEATGADACIEHVLVDPSERTDARPEAGHGVGIGAHNVRQAIRRYYRQRWSVGFTLPGGRRRELALVTSLPFIVRRLAPYRRDFPCWTGSQWFSLRRGAASALLDWHARNPWLADYLRRREAPDESYPQTVLANTPGLRLAQENFRFVRWGLSSHPRELAESDLPEMLASGAHFARKFAPDAPVLDRLDAHLDAETQATPVRS